MNLKWADHIAAVTTNTLKRLWFLESRGITVRPTGMHSRRKTVVA